MAELVFQKKKGHDELSLQAQQPTSISRSAQEIDEEACQGQGAREQLKTFWAWATVVSAFFMQMTCFGYAATFGVYQDFYVREYLTASSSSAISLIGSVQTFVMLTMGVVTGPLFDRGYGYHLVFVGSAILIFSLFMLSLAQPNQFYQIFLSQGVGVGIGGALLYVPSLAVQAHHFKTPSGQARAMSLAVAGVPIAGIVHPILLDQLLYRSGNDKVTAFRLATRASAGFITGLQVVALLLMRTRYDKDHLRGRLTASERVGVARSVMRFARLIVRYASDVPYVCIVAGLSLFEVVFFFPIFYLQLYSIQNGLSATFAFYSLSILNASSFVGRFVSGFVTKHFGIMNIFSLSAWAMTAVLFCMLAAHNIPGVATFAVFYGLVSGSYMTLMAPVLALFAENPNEIGSRMGLCFTVSGVGSLIGTPIAGALLTSQYIWWRPVVFSGIVCAIGASFFIVGYRLMIRQKRHR